MSASPCIFFSVAAEIANAFIDGIASLQETLPPLQHDPFENPATAENPTTALIARAFIDGFETASLSAV